MARNGSFVSLLLEAGPKVTGKSKLLLSLATAQPYGMSSKHYFFYYYLQDFKYFLSCSLSQIKSYKFTFEHFVDFSELCSRFFFLRFPANISNGNKTPPRSHVRSETFKTIFFLIAGYGHSTPNTISGKLFTMFYAIVGIPLGLVMFQSIGERLNKFSSVVIRKVKQLLNCKDVQVIRRKCRSIFIPKL